MELSSTAFADHGEIPRRHTCDGEDIAPPLLWHGVPDGAASLALIVDDPDAPDPAAPKMTWVHWVVYDLPPTTTALAEAAKPPGLVGKNDWKKESYGGPHPPIGRHRYFFKLYALDTMIGKPGLTKKQLEQAMEGHVLAHAELVGTYQMKK